MIQLSRRNIIAALAVAVTTVLVLLAAFPIRDSQLIISGFDLSVLRTTPASSPPEILEHPPDEQLPTQPEVQPSNPAQDDSTQQLEGETGVKPEDQPTETPKDKPQETPKEEPKKECKEPPKIEELLKREKEAKRKEAWLNSRERQLNLRDQVLFREEELVAEKARPPPEKSLISFVYVESPTNRRNLEFFIQHALYDSADFIFTFNGETDAHELLPNHPKSPWYNPNVHNIEVIHRENKCYDFGAHGAAMLREWDDEGKGLKPMGDKHEGGKTFWEGYSRFILMNASIRGPFMPYWSKECWSEVFWNLITDKNKLVGMTYACHADQGHVQSMLWATDRIGMSLLMQHPAAGVGYWCPLDMIDAIYGETRTTTTFHAAGYEIDALNAVYHSRDGDDINMDGRPDHRPDNYLKGCTDDDFFHENAYYGFNIHPYETIFMKSGRHMQELLLGNMTLWADGSGYSSYDYCDRVSIS